MHKLYVGKSIDFPVSIQQSLPSFEASCPSFIILVIDRRKEVLVMITNSYFCFYLSFFFVCIGSLYSCNQRFYWRCQLNNRFVIALWQAINRENKFVYFSDCCVVCQSIISLVHPHETKGYLIQSVLWIIGIFKIFVQVVGYFFIQNFVVGIIIDIGRWRYHFCRIVSGLFEDFHLFLIQVLLQRLVFHI